MNKSSLIWRPKDWPKFRRNLDRGVTPPFVAIRLNKQFIIMNQNKSTYIQHTLNKHLANLVSHMSRIDA